MKVKLKISITNSKNDSFMGIGLVWLLQRIEKFKSINKAAKDMKLSYVKALKMLKKLQNNLRKKILIKKRGGYEGGGAELTPYAKKFIKEYDKFQKDIKSYAERSFARFIKKISNYSGA